MEVREKHDVELLRDQSLDPRPPGFLRAANDAGTAVDEIRMPPRHDRDGRTGTVGIGVGIPGAEEDDTGGVGRLGRKNAGRPEEAGERRSEEKDQRPNSSDTWHRKPGRTSPPSISPSAAISRISSRER